MLIFFICLFCKLLTYFPTLDFSLGAALYIGFAYLLTILVSSLLARSLITERFNFTLLEHGIEVIDLLTRRRKIIPAHSLKGFSTGTLKRRFDTLEQVVLYCANGDVYPIVENNFYNFKALRNAIKRHGNLRFLGKEELNWTFTLVLKDMLNKQYKFR
ncbi:hypothetical protein [Spirosoma radiotolerans]|nr:hypothetical protein [Spirosoma radiotolerans]